MEITKVAYKSKLRFMGLRLNSPVMGYEGELIVYLRNGGSFFQGGKLKPHLDYSFSSGLSRGSSGGYLEEAEIPKLKPYWKKKIRIETHRLPFETGMLNPAKLTIKIIDKEEKTIGTFIHPLNLTTEEIAKERMQSKLILIMTILTFLAVMVSLVLYAVK